MKAIKYIFLFLFISFSGNFVIGQVITQIGKENMKIPFGEKPDIVEKASRQMPVEVQLDTTAVYYAMIDSAQYYIETKNWARAEEFIRKAISTEPDNNTNSMLLSNLGTIQRYEGKLDDAIKNYSLALDMTPNAVTLLLNRAAVYLQIGKIANAENDYTKARSLDPKDVESRYSLGMLAVNKHDFEKAKELFYEIKDINPRSGLSSEGLGLMYKEQGDYNNAIKYLSEVLRVTNNPVLLANRADCYLVLKQLNNAEEDIRNALSLTPDDGYLYLLRAKLNKLRFNYDDMNRDLDLARKNGINENEINLLDKQKQ